MTERQIEEHWSMNDEYIAGLGLGYILKDQEDLIGAEIGVNTGVTTEYWLQNLKIQKLYAIDPWLPYDGPSAGTTHPTEPMAEGHYRETLSRIAPFKDKVEVLKMTSEEAAKIVPDDSLDFVFIDGNHSYEFVRQDMGLWWPKVKLGGIFAGHDYSHGDVNRALGEFCAEVNVFNIRNSVNDAWWFYRGMR